MLVNDPHQQGDREEAKMNEKKKTKSGRLNS